MEALLIVQSIALLVLTVSNLLTVQTLKKVRADLANPVTPQRYILNAPQVKVPTTEEIVEKIKQYEESQKPKSFGAIFIEEQKKYDEWAAAQKPEDKPVAYFVDVTHKFNNPNPEVAHSRPFASPNAKKSLEENVVVDEHAQKLAEADAVIKEHADEQKIELAQKWKAKSHKAQMEAKKVQDHTDLREN